MTLASCAPIDPDSNMALIAQVNMTDALKLVDGDSRLFWSACERAANAMLRFRQSEHGITNRSDLAYAMVKVGVAYRNRFLRRVGRKADGSNACVLRQSA